jgi:hypothetical protein
MRGGGRHNNGSKLEPLARWLGRRLIWMSGKKYDDIKSNIEINDQSNERDDIHDGEIYSDIELVSL